VIGWSILSVGSVANEREMSARPQCCVLLESLLAIGIICILHLLNGFLVMLLFFIAHTGICIYICIHVNGALLFT